MSLTTLALLQSLAMLGLAAGMVAQIVLLSRSARVTGKDLRGLASVARETHALVNSSMGTQLRVAWKALKRVAELTNHPDDREAAEAAARLFAEHQRRQAKADGEAGRQ